MNLQNSNINIDKEIGELLARYGVARVPGVGTFSLEHQNARLRTNLLLPPGDVVVFSADANCQNDNTLAEQIMRDRKVSFAEAQAIVKEASKTLDIPSICGWKSYLPQNLGLKPLNITELNHDSILRDIAKYAAAVAVALTLNLTVPYNKPNQTISEASLMPELLLNATEPTAEEQIVEETPAEPKEYCVIVSSLTSREDAVNWTIAHNLCDSAEIIECNGHFRISASRFSSYADAEAFIKDNSLKAWVFHDTSL